MMECGEKSMPEKMKHAINGMKALQFHRITPRFQLCGTWNTPTQFESFLRILRDSEVDIVLPTERRDGVIITFDDGEKSVYQYAFPLLRKYDIKALIFVVVDYVGKKNLWDITLTGQHTEHLSWQEIGVMNDHGIEFGSHTMTHGNLVRMSDSDIEYELSVSRQILEKRLGRCVCVSYPFNRVDQRVTKIAVQAGYRYGFGGDGSTDLLIRKEAVYITDTPYSLAVKVREEPRWFYQYERMKQKVINIFTIATMVT